MSRRTRPTGQRHGTARAVALLEGRAPRFAPEALEARKLLAVVAWDGDAGDGDFTNPLNWEGDLMPLSGDDAVIDVNGGPFIELRAGDSASLKSLLVDWPLAINGTLGVSDQMTVGAVFFDIGPSGRLESNNITLQASTGGITNQGEWTIGGTSLIDRRIVSEGTLVIAQEATITLGIGLNAALQYGSIDVAAGQMTIREGVSMTGAGRPLDQLRVVTTLNVDGGATFVEVGLNADGTNLISNVRLNFGETLVSTFTDSKVRLDYALVTGRLSLDQSEVEVNGRALIYGDVTVEGGHLSLRGALMTRAPVLNPTGEGALAMHAVQISMNGTLNHQCWLLGDIAVSESQILVTRVARFGDGLTLRDVELVSTGGGGGGPFHRPYFWTIEGELTASDLVTSGPSQVRVLQNATLTLDGGANRIENQLIVLGAINWMDGDLLITTIGGATSQRSLVGAPGEIRGVFTGPGSHRLDLIGDEQYRFLVVRGGLSFSFDDPAGEVVVNGTMSNRGTVEVTGGILHYQTGLIGFNGGTFGGNYGEWIVGPDATFEIDEAFTEHSGTLTVIGNGQVPAMAGMTLNTGVITLSGAGGWLADDAAAFRNYGEIHKTGEGERIVPVAITQLVHGLIAVEQGHLTIDSALFVNRGHLVVGSNSFMSPRAVFRTTGDYREGGHSLLEIVGVSDGDPDDLPRFGVDGTMNLSGRVKVVLSPLTPFPQSTTWQLGFAGQGRNGLFGRGAQVSVPGALGRIVYAGQRFLVMIEV